jgi:hypothetical protein
LRNAEVDVARFDELVADDRLDEALAMCSGDLLAGIDDEWAIVARESHRDRATELLRDQSDKAAANGDSALAIERARHAAELNPLSETCARSLMHRYEEARGSFTCPCGLRAYRRTAPPRAENRAVGRNVAAGPEYPQPPAPPCVAGPDAVTPAGDDRTRRP